MFTIPSSYRNNYENYITLPVIKKFISANHICNLSQSREALLIEIEKYADANKENEEEVLNWLDDVLQEGIKEVYLRIFEMEQGIKTLMNSVKTAQNHLDTYVSNGVSGHICGNFYEKDFKLIKATVHESEFGMKLIFLFCKKMITYDKNTNFSQVIDYPVIAEYYVDSNWLLVKAKPKSNLYEYMENFTIDKGTSTNSEKQIMEIENKITGILGFISSDWRLVESTLKTKVFELLSRFSDTPASIKEILDEHEDMVKKISTLIQTAANAPSRQIINVEEDIRNILEKYISINWKNKDDFKTDREAFPVKLIATDDEESKVEQESKSREALQTKEIFFDNKKRLYTNKKCDGVEFEWARKNKGYFDSDHFNVSFVE